MPGVRFAVAVLLLGSSMPLQNVESPANGVIHGVVTAADGQPAKGIGLIAEPLGVALAAALPRTKSDDAGEYRFEHVPWWGRYTVYADDDDAGYSSFSTGCGGTPCPEVTIGPSHSEAELNVRLPPRAGFVEIRLTNRDSGAPISGMFFEIDSAEQPSRRLFGGSWPSNKAILLPPNRDLLLHVNAPDFAEWRESVGKGKAIRLSPGERVRLDVSLQPQT